MRFAIAFILAVAALVAWRALQPACPGGAVVADEAQCRARFDALFCLEALPRMQRLAKTSGGGFSTQAECLDQYPACLPRSDVSGWAPKPAAFCVARAPDGAIARIEPIYSRR